MNVTDLVTAAASAVERYMLTDTCRIRRHVDGTAGAMGQPQSWPGVSAVCPCQVQTQRPATTPGSDVVDNAILPRTRAVTLPRGIAVEAPDRIEWVQGHVTLEVMGEQLETGSHGMLVVVNCVEVEP
jgi:hypothetical protein